MNLIELARKDRQQLASLFTGHLGGLIPTAILEGKMGKALVDNTENPRFAVLELPGVGLSVLAGDAEHPLARSYLHSLSRITNLFFTSADFATLIQQTHPNKCVEFTRYAFSAEHLDLDQLNAFKNSIPHGFRIEEINLSLAKQLKERKNRFAEVHTLNFTPENFVTHAVGFCALEGEQITCVASSFAVCEEGIEIQIDTKGSYKNRGLATAVAAHLIVHCLERDLTPSWDAATEVSAIFAEKLGYVCTGEYQMLVFTNSRLLVALRNQVQKIKPYLQRLSKRNRRVDSLIS